MFGRKKTTEEKFGESRTAGMVRFVITLCRNSKMKVPQNDATKVIIAVAKEIDPENKMPGRELVARLSNEPRVIAVLSTVKKERILSDDELKDYVQQYYQLIKKALISTKAEEYDALEYQSQQLIAIKSVDDGMKFMEVLKETMLKDDTCPYVFKKYIETILSGVKPPAPPTVEEERLSEKIISLVNPNLEKTNPDVFRALVDSFKWRGKAQLERALECVKATPPSRRKIRGRESCLFIESDEGVHYIG